MEVSPRRTPAWSGRASHSCSTNNSQKRLGLPASSPAWPEAELQDDLTVFSGIGGYLELGSLKGQMKNKMASMCE